MARTLPRKPTKKQQLIIRATADYFGLPDKYREKISVRQSIVKISLWLMGRKVRNELNKDEKEAMEMIKINLEDETYRKTFETDENYEQFSSIYSF